MEVKLTPTGRVSKAKTIADYQCTERNKYRNNEEYREKLKIQAAERYRNNPEYKERARARYKAKKTAAIARICEEQSVITTVARSAVVGGIIGLMGGLLGWAPALRRIIG